MTTNHTTPKAGSALETITGSLAGIDAGIHADPSLVAGTETKLAQTANESIRAINHLTIDGKAIPAPEVYDLLGHLKCLGYGLDQVIRQLSRALGASLGVYAVYEDDGGNPEESVMYAMDAMRLAAEHGARIGALLEGAQTDISRQGYHRNPSRKPNPHPREGR